MLENYNEVLTINEVQDILFISRNTAYSLLRSGKIHSFKIGNTWRIPRFAVEDYIGYKPKPKQGKFSV